MTSAAACAYSVKAIIRNRRGLHARAAAKFAKLAGTFDADVMVRRDSTEVSGVSIMGLMMLAASNGTEIQIMVSGNQAREALDALNILVEAKFEES